MICKENSSVHTSRASKLVVWTHIASHNGYGFATKRLEWKTFLDSSSHTAIHMGLGQSLKVWWPLQTTKRLDFLQSWLRTRHPSFVDYLGPHQRMTEKGPLRKPYSSRLISRAFI